MFSGCYTDDEALNQREMSTKNTLSLSMNSFPVMKEMIEVSSESVENNNLLRICSPRIVVL